MYSSSRAEAASSVFLQRAVGAQLPDQLSAGHWPGYACCSPIMVVLTTADPPTSKLEPHAPPPPLFHLQNATIRQQRVETAIPLSTGVAWAAKPASDPAAPPTRWLTPPPTICC